MKVTSVVKHFMESKSKKELKLDLIAECHHIKDRSIIHMILTNSNKCLVFIKDEDNPNSTHQYEKCYGPIKVYLCRENFSKEDLKNKYEINLKYEYLRQGSGGCDCIF